MENPLEKWIYAKTAGKDIKEYQFEKVIETLEYVGSRSKFYKKLYEGTDISTIKSFTDFEKLPFTAASDLINYGAHMICVPQHEIERIVTLYTSGTTGEPKRVYFTEADQELTIDFFHHGMTCIINEKDNFMILLPYKKPGSVGDLLIRGLKRLGCGIYPYGLVEDDRHAGEFIVKNKITSLVGSPVQVLKLAELTKEYGLDIKLNSVLLSVEYIPDATVKRLENLWDCKVYEHYGMTEMCFGGGVYCEHLQGYHMREADLYFEIVSESGEVLPDGEYGEVVFTTLTRTGMPLVRYRTGDYGRFKTEYCACSNYLKLMEKVKGRISNGVAAVEKEIQHEAKN